MQDEKLIILAMVLMTLIPCSEQEKTFANIDEIFLALEKHTFTECDKN
tara:strand:+ start:273 stop:416 length:144 start_codon:yes stop_codon:yes gene_type:complete